VQAKLENERREKEQREKEVEEAVKVKQAEMQQKMDQILKEEENKVLLALKQHREAQETLKLRE